MATVIGRSFSFRLGAQVLSALINVAGMAVLGNTLAASGYGEYAFYYALVPLIAALSDLGIGAIVTREVARDPATGSRQLGDALVLKALISVGLLIVVGAITPWALDPARRMLVILVTASALIDFSQDVGVWIFRAHDRQDLEAYLLMASQGIRFAGLLICAVLHASLFWFLASATVGFALRTVLSFWIVERRFYRPAYAPTAARLGALVREGLPYGVAMFVVVLYGRIGVLMLKGIATTADIAFFNVGYMLSQPLGFISSAFNVSAFPSLSRAWLAGPAAVRPLMRPAVKFQFVASLPLTVWFCLLADRIVPLLLKDADFHRASPALQVMSLGLPVIFLNLMSRHVLTAFDRQRAYLAAILVGLGVNVASGFWLIRHFGATGACAALVVGELAVFVVCKRAFESLLSMGDLGRELVKPLAAALVMGAVVFVLRHAHLIVVTLAAAGSYGAALLALRAFSAEELRLLRAAYASFRMRRTGARDGHPESMRSVQS